MASGSTFPYFAKATIKYKSPHKQDLTFAKGEIIKVTSTAPKGAEGDDANDSDDDDDWLIGESLDGSRKGTFPGGFVTVTSAPVPASSGDSEGIPVEAPAQLQSSMLEEDPAAHGASVVPSAAIDDVEQGVTPQNGPGASLAARSVSPDAEQTPAEEEPTSVSPPAVARSKSGSSVSAAATVSPPKDLPSKSPPPISSKPANMSTSFRDRLAAFNKPADAAPPPLPKAKPGGWKRPAQSSEAPSSSAAIKPTPLAIPKVPEAAQSTSPISASGGDVEPTGVGAFSAADAQSSIKMSLKERMAALQRNEGAASDAAPDARPKPAAPGRIAADKRNAAMQGMGLAPPSAPTRKMSSDSSTSVQDSSSTGLHSTDVVQEEDNPSAVDDAESTFTKGSIADAEDHSTAVQETTATDEAEEQTEEEKETERRAAIAKRMAALGARRMGGGPAVISARAPPPSNSKEGATSEPGITTNVSPLLDQLGKDAEATDSSPTEPTTEVASPVAEDEPKILSVPRRAAGPRKKRSAGPTSAAAASSQEEQVAPEADPRATEATSEGLAAASSAADAMDTSKDAGEPNTTESHAITSDSLESTKEHGKSGGQPTAEGVAAASAAADAMDTSQPETTDVPAHATDVSLPAAADNKDTSEAQEKRPMEEGTTEESDAEIAEHQRQLEEYLRGEGFFEGNIDSAGANVRPTVSDQAMLTSPEREPASPKLPSRPTSIRPPVPRTSLPPPPIVSQDESDDVIQKPPTPSIVSQRAGSISQVSRTLPSASETDSSAAADVEEDIVEAETTDEAGPVLAAPKARMAMPTDDPEDEQILAAADLAQERDLQAEHGGVLAADPEELTEEEQDSQRRANLARRMAALGGQRIGAFPGMAPPPIMGAPMPARAQSRATQDEAAAANGTPTKMEEGVPSTEQEEIEAVSDQEEDFRQDESLEAPPAPTSPPPKPMSPPPPARPLPPVLPPGRPSSTAPVSTIDGIVRSGTAVESTGLKRSSSRPPVPQAVPRSRDVSVSEEFQDVSTVSMSSPPLPATSPPPRPTSRAPPLPGAHRRQGSATSSELPAVPARTESPASDHMPKPPLSRAAIPSSASTMSVPGSEARQSSRDLDLMPSGRWWRHGLNPLRLPPTVAGRPDAILYIDSSPKAGADPNMHQADIHMLFEDYSTTVISLSFVDDDADEAHTSLKQRHNFPPSKPSIEALRQWSTHIGSVVAKLAGDAAKQANAPIADGSPRGFVENMIGSVPNALPPVGQSLGVAILTQVGPTMMQPQADEVRSGDIVSCSQADFRGKKGLAPYHMTFGTQAEPTSGIVIECETKKNKLRCIVQSPNNKKGLPDEVSLRLDDLKSGIVKVYRVPPRQGWIQDW